MNTNISIEFFPPQTPEGVEKLRATRAELAKLQPEFFSVTYGAGGSTRERTFAIVREIAHGAGVPVLPVYFHYPDKIIGVGEVFHLGEDMDADMARIRACRGALVLVRKERMPMCRKLLRRFSCWSNSGDSSISKSSRRRGLRYSVRKTKATTTPTKPATGMA